MGSGWVGNAASARSMASWDPTQVRFQDLAEEGLGAALVGFQVTGPLGLGLGQGAYLTPPQSLSSQMDWMVRSQALTSRFSYGFPIFWV